MNNVSYFFKTIFNIFVLIKLALILKTLDMFIFGHLFLLKEIESQLLNFVKLSSIKNKN